MNEAIPVTEKKPAPPPPKPERVVPASLASGQKRPESIAVRMMRFSHAMQIPGDDSSTSLKCDANSPPNRKHWRVNYIPAIRHFEIFYYPAEQHRAVEVGYVHETHVDSWFAA